MLSTKSKPELAVCWQSFASQTTAVSRGTTFPADDPGQAIRGAFC
jgi:hypothetical protein